MHCESPQRQQMSDSKDDYSQMEDIPQTQGLALWDEEEMINDDMANWQASITTFLVMGVQPEQEGRLAQTRGHQDLSYSPSVRF